MTLTANWDHVAGIIKLHWLHGGYVLMTNAHQETGDEYYKQFKQSDCRLKRECKRIG